MVLESFHHAKSAKRSKKCDNENAVCLCITFTVNKNNKNVSGKVLDMFMIRGLNNFDSSIVSKSSILC